MEERSMRYVINVPKKLQDEIEKMERRYDKLPSSELVGIIKTYENVNRVIRFLNRVSGSFEYIGYRAAKKVLEKRMEKGLTNRLD